MIEHDVFKQAAKLIEQATSILITTHTKPDGDACGSVAALIEAFRAKGKTVQPLAKKAQGLASDYIESVYLTS